MNLLLFGPRDRCGEDQIRITGPRLQHMQEVLDVSTGDTLRVGEINGLCGDGRILSINANQALLAVELDVAPPAKLPLCLVLALPRPKMLRRIIRTVAELGIGELHLINSYRVEKSYWQTPALQERTLQSYFLQGLAQARDTVLPELHCHRRFKPFVEDSLPELAAGRLALLAHPGDHAPCPRALAQPTLLAIGPEGGFIPYEVEKLQQAGCSAVTLGPRILRVETALTALVGRLF